MKNNENGKGWKWDPWLWLPRTLILLTFYAAVLGSGMGGWQTWLRWVALWVAAWIVFWPIVWLLTNRGSLAGPLCDGVKKGIKRMWEARKWVVEQRSKIVDVITLFATLVIGAIAYEVVFGRAMAGGFAFAGQQEWERWLFGIVTWAFLVLLIIDLAYINIRRKLGRYPIAGSFLLSEKWVKNLQEWIKQKRAIKNKELPEKPAEPENKHL